MFENQIVGAYLKPVAGNGRDDDDGQQEDQDRKSILINWAAFFDLGLFASVLGRIGCVGRHKSSPLYQKVGPDKSEALRRSR